MALRDYIVNNFWWKLLSLLLAALTWLTIRTAFERDQNLQESPVVNSSRRSFPALPITLLTSPTNLNRYRVDPPSVSVEVSGTEAELKKLQEKEVHLYVDISDVRDEKQVHRRIETQAPGDLKVTSLSQTYANVERTTGSKAAQSATNLNLP